MIYEGNQLLKKYLLKHKWLWGAVLVCFILFTNVTTVKANDQLDAIQEAQNGLEIAPPNLGLDSQLFTRGDFSGFTGNPKNMANLVNEGDSTISSSYSPYRAIRMTQFKSEKGAIWSNVEGGNYVDIMHKQTLSLWMYFGKEKHINGSTEFGDGMAFVLQNSTAGVKAFSGKNGVIGGGESLGVWGMDNDSKVSDPQKIADTAIQDSWAMEFDTYVNKQTSPGAAQSFDLNTSGQHIAYGYPAEAATYTPHYTSGSWLGGDSGYYFSMEHGGIQNNLKLNDAKWHHLTITWNPINFTITYKFNDKDPATGAELPGALESTTATVKATAFGGHQSLAGGKLRWGFTASTGSAFEPNLIAFESIPSSVESTVTSDIVDTTQNKTIDETATDRKVNSNDNLNINYHLKYDTGKDVWDKIKAQLVLPSQVSYTDGTNNQVIGKVTYDDGSDNEPIYASELTTNSSGQTFVNHNLAKDLSKNAPSKANITIYGKANNVTTETKVPAVSSHFESDVLIQDVMSQAFSIQKAKPINLSLDRQAIEVKSGQAADITGTVSYGDGATIDNYKVKVHTTLNGTALDVFPMSDTNTASGKLSLTIPAAKLTQPKNTLTVYVEDENGNVSQTSTVIITKKGGLALKLDDYSFGAINQVTASMLIPRKGIWNIVVDDTRADGTKSAWNLSAQTNGLYKGTTPFKGDVIYRNANGSENSLSNKAWANIASGYKTQSGEQETNVGKSWNDSEGIMLKTSGLNEAGMYSGTMNWTLSDAV